LQAFQPLWRGGFGSGYVRSYDTSACTTREANREALCSREVARQPLMNPASKINR
jgi:hypothetical protein